MDSGMKELKNKLLELRLKYLSDQLDEVMLPASCSDKPYAQLLNELLDVEIMQRRRIAMEKRHRLARLPAFDTPFNLDSYDFAIRTGVSKRQITELASNFLWIDKAYNVLFFGGSGLGKSFLACYLGYKAMEAGYNAAFIALHDLAHLLKTEGTLSRSKTRMKQLRACDLLIIDEIGNTVLDRQEGNRLFQLISDFYQQTSLITISNKGFDDWVNTLGDQVVTAAVMDRLLHKCEIFNIGGESWRIEKQQSILDNLIGGRKT